ncbi:MAG: FAD-dependent oxidoreductase [Phycisphaera sp.]|nr:FAD-dependent oxidoreductase [Phycisphaera sp.]
MKTEPSTDLRSLRTEKIDTDLVVVGGGLAGLCGAVAAARQGLRVALVQDRPVLGGNASSEVRLWTLGATAHMGNNNRWAREGGVIDEILIENLFVNPDNNPHRFDALLLDKALAEPNLTLLLNTAVDGVTKRDADTIASVTGYCSQNSTRYEIAAPLFCDASGDGVVGFLSGAAFRMGAESVAEFGEKFAPGEAYGELLGHSMYFYSKDLGRPVDYVPPSFAHRDIEKIIPRYRSFKTSMQGCQLWWIEYGGRLDTVHDTEKIKWELWRVVYGVWDYIKNSGKFPDARNLTLEWVSTIPGKRESRRFEGDYMLRQQDVIEGRTHEDDVSFGGWALDLHPADGVYSEFAGCTHWQARSVYPIPYRCLYSRNIRNLFLAGRIISATHAAFGSTRVMGTCAHGAQAVGVAAAICMKKGKDPRDLATGALLREMQRRLRRVGQYIPRLRLDDPDDLCASAKIETSSTLVLRGLPDGGPTLKVGKGQAQMLPLLPGKVPSMTVTLDVPEACTLTAELRVCSRVEGHTPDVVLVTKDLTLQPGTNQRVQLAFDATVDLPRYGFVILRGAEEVSIHTSPVRVTGLLSLRYSRDQRPEGDIGVESFEFWTPARRPAGHNWAMRIEPGIDAFDSKNLATHPRRPTGQPNAWVADLDDPQPSVTLIWHEPATVARLDLFFDCDYDHSVESALMQHPDRAMPYCVKAFRVTDERGAAVFHTQDQHLSLRTIRFDPPLLTARLKVELFEVHGRCPAALLGIAAFAPSPT